MPRAGNRFVKGRSGNPGGRPRRPSTPVVSAFEIVFDKVLTVTRGGETREIGVDEALQQKTYQDAIAGSRMARREVIKWIEKREKAIKAKAPPPPGPIRTIEHTDPRNANEALVLLGIAKQTGDENHPQLSLLRWAVQAALDRRRRRAVEGPDRKEIQLRTLEADRLVWPGDPSR